MCVTMKTIIYVYIYKSEHVSLRFTIMITTFKQVHETTMYFIVHCSLTTPAMCLSTIDDDLFMLGVISLRDKMQHLSIEEIYISNRH
jgi:hypothetical protein